MGGSEYIVWNKASLMMLLDWGGVFYSETKRRTRAWTCCSHSGTKSLSLDTIN